MHCLCFFPWTLSYLFFINSPKHIWICFVVVFGDGAFGFSFILSRNLYSLTFHPLVKNTVYIWVPSPLTTASVLFICGTTCNSGKVYLVVSRAVYLHHYLFWGIPTVVLGTLQFFFSGQLKIAFNSSGVNFSTMTTQFILSCNRSLQNLTSCLTVNEKAKGPIWLLLITH